MLSSQQLFLLTWWVRVRACLSVCRVFVFYYFIYTHSITVVESGFKRIIWFIKPLIKIGTCCNLVAILTSDLCLSMTRLKVPTQKCTQQNDVSILKIYPQRYLDIIIIMIIISDPPNISQFSDKNMSQIKKGNANLRLIAVFSALVSPLTARSESAFTLDAESDVLWNSFFSMACIWFVTALTKQWSILSTSLQTIWSYRLHNRTDELIYLSMQVMHMLTG